MRTPVKPSLATLARATQPADALGMPAVLPPAEQIKLIETANWAWRAEQQRELLM